MRHPIKPILPPRGFNYTRLPLTQPKWETIRTQTATGTTDNPPAQPWQGKERRNHNRSYKRDH